MVLPLRSAQNKKDFGCQCSADRQLTGNKSTLVEGVPPVVRDFDELFGHSFALRRVPLLVCVLSDLLQVGRLESVNQVEEVLSIRNSSLRHLRWEEPHELLVRLKHWPQFDDGKFIVLRNGDSFDLVQTQKRLFFNEDLFEEIFVEHPVWRQVQLH